MEQQQDAAPSSSASPPRTPRKRRLSADASSDKKRRVSSSPSPPRDATLRIVTQTLRDENRQLQQEREALEQDKRALGERLARSQRSLRDLEEDVARVYRQKQQELEAQRRAFEQKLQARPTPAETQASKETSSAALHSQQTTQEMDREIEKLKPRKGELKILYAKFSSAMDSVSEKTMRLEELARNKELEQELQKLRSSARGIESQNKKLENQVAELQQQVADLSAVQRRDKSVNEELLKVQKQCAELRELESQQKELASKMQSELAALKAQNEALKEQQVKREHQSVGQPSIEGDKSSRDSSSSYAVQVAEKEALQMFVQRYSSATEAECNKLLEKVSELQSAKTLIQEQTKETCTVLRMCTQVDSCDESIRASLLDVMATLESLT
ncbi:hypothetical protein PHYSODRAFT_531791 [Phytophthora sojae]|uniref:Uncharacterized protein n=1 Tax=Phytophthora sojae (strain P6497) TaxID=1094619 RepID=G5ADU5_PHYSP|nr:hypothetical protein PHYSODRAFT_531791 [Phytophthora sojae]EGZ06347.1 hypothetical protein PHYSODRAFT_531791 [Phytophthora sojae]|eukprot:XP_009538244.1 hypothetical protein PHYSODRAFT_531791 [Phytophthora sojae]